MKKIIITTIIIVTLGLAITASAEYIEVDNGIRFLRSSFEAGNSFVESFEDTKTGIICYVVNPENSYIGTGISCIKK